MNPLPDEDGDRICEECGCILPEKVSTVWGETHFMSTESTMSLTDFNLRVWR
jgi:hypothetical protein